MSESKHTPGPWAVEGSLPLGSGQYTINVSTVPDAMLVATVEADGTSEEQAMADARLIAAAPDMLAALESITKKLRDLPIPVSPGVYRRLAGALSDVANAIAKAKGEEDAENATH